MICTDITYKTYTIHRHKPLGKKKQEEKVIAAEKEAGYLLSKHPI
jgi:hypothetical protein